MGGDTLLTFILAVVVLSFAPGPDNIFVLTQSALHGKRSGIYITLGLCTGLIVHTVAVAFGITAIFMASATAFTVLKVIGAAYLLYLAWQTFNASSVSINANKTHTLPAWSLYRRGIIMNLSNPKVGIFFLAFLPQFANPELGSLTQQLIILGGIFITVSFITFNLIALLSGLIAEWLKASNKAQIIINRIATVVFISLAIKLASTTR